MFIIGEKTNQLCNRLCNYRDIFAAAIELGHSVVVPFFEDHAPYFVGTCRNLFCRFPGPSKSLWYPSSAQRKILRKLTTGSVQALQYRDDLLARKLNIGLVSSGYETTLTNPGGDYDLGSHDFADLAQRTRLIVMRGPLFRVKSKDWVAKHAATIRSYFEPIERIRTAADRVVAHARQNGLIVVGVHIRRGDYQTFVGGRYFFTHEEYAATMRMVCQLFQGQTVAFLLSSNDIIPDAPYANLNVLTGSGEALEDLYALSGCDYLIGPPSTFGDWASFHGDVPRYTIMNPRHIPKLTEFVRSGRNDQLQPGSR